MCQIPQTLRIHSKYTHYILNTFNTPKYLNWNYFSVSSGSRLDEKIKKNQGQICLNSENHGKNHLEATADKKQVFSSLLLVEVVLCHFFIFQAGCGRQVKNKKPFQQQICQEKNRLFVTMRFQPKMAIQNSFGNKKTYARSNFFIISL